MRYDIIIMGHVSKDIIVDHLGKEERLWGGALYYSAITAAAAGAKVLAITKCAREDMASLNFMRITPNLDLVVAESPATTSILNVFKSADRERRDTTLLSRAAPFAAVDIPESANAPIIDLAGLFVGELPDSLIAQLSQRAKVAVDAQGLLRTAMPDGSMLFRNWAAKKDLMRHVSYFKADAAEAEILTGLSGLGNPRGLTDREAAAKLIAGWAGDDAADSGKASADAAGDPEVMITHNTEVIVFAEGAIHRAPFTPSNLSGRTGRGDTTFSSYLIWRREHSPEESIRFAAALCSMKMEKPGPFTGTLDDVFRRIEMDSGKR
jgi:sugar/nucleoside kinase (ribokinase family)